MKKIKDKNNLILVGLAFIYALIYIYRMFTNNPWYDELYTYYSFISRGPIYAAIHWPLPNNHIGYSAISGFLSYFGNPTIALRGISFICAVANIFLVYKLANSLTGKRRAYIAVFIYAGVFQVHNMAVQGRGYTLSTTCYLIALLMLLNIFNAKDKWIHYFLYMCVLALGIYAVPSSTFWVIPVCVFGGIYLLCAKEYKRLIKLIIFSALAALIALSLYATVWLAIGSNLLSKTADSGYFGVYQIEVIKKAPALSLKTGLDYMLASPYIQSMDRNIVINGLFYYLEALFEQFYGGLGIAIIVFLFVSGVVATVRFIKQRNRVLELFIAVSVIMLPIMLIVQSVQPYLRVFSYFGLVLSFSVIMYLNVDKTTIYNNIATVIIGVLFIGLLFTYKYMMPMADRENDIKDICDELILNGTTMNEIGSIYYTDDYQKYVFKFYYDVDPVEAPMGEAEYVFVSDTVKNSEIEGIVWPMLTSYPNFDFDLLNSDYEDVLDLGTYSIYRHKDN